MNPALAISRAGDARKALLLSSVTRRWLTATMCLFLLAAGGLAYAQVPIITVQPQSQTASAGTNVTFNVNAQGVPPLTYQWRKESVPIIAGTNATLTITNVQPVNAGLYSVLVTNSAGSITSTPATLTARLLAWNRRYGSANLMDRAYGIAIDLSNNVIVTGELNYTNADYATLKYDPTGTLLWTRNYDSTNQDRARAVAVDAQNNIVVSGFVTGPTAGANNRNHTVIKYDSNGNILWRRAHSSLSAANDLSPVAVDSSNNVISARAIELTKYSPNGDIMWDYDTVIPEWEHYLEVFGAAVDSFGDVLVTGRIKLTNGPNYYFATAKYFGSNGLLAWYKYEPFTQSSGGEGVGMAVVADANNNVIATGRVLTAGGYSFFTVKYDADGNLLWTKALDSAIATYSWGFGAAATPDGRVFVTGAAVFSGETAYTIEYSAAGEKLWNGAYPVSGTLGQSIAIDRSTNILIAGWREWSATDEDFLTFKYVSISGMGPPSILVPPQSQNVTQAASVAFSVIADGSQPLSYQWRSNGVNIASATNSSITLSNVQPASSGVGYSVIITNSSGAVTSSAARLLVFTRLWTGLGDGQSWNAPLNWSGGTLPNPSDSVFIGEGSSTVTNLPAELTVKNLLCLRGLSVTGSLEVTGSANIIGSLYLAPQSEIKAVGPDARVAGEGPVTADAANLFALDGGVLQLSGLTHYSAVTGTGELRILADEADSVIDLPSLRELKGAKNTNSVEFQAFGGGRVSLSGLTNVTCGRIHFYAGDPDSMIDLPVLKTFTGPGIIKAESGATIAAGELTAIHGVSLEIYAGSLIGLGHLESVTSSPDLDYVRLYADGVGSELNLSCVHQLEGNDDFHLFGVVARNGGGVDLSGLRQISSGLPDLEASADGSWINLSTLGTAAGPGKLYAFGGGTVFAGQLTNLMGASVDLYPNSAIILTNLKHYSSGEVDSYITARSRSELDLSSVQQVKGSPHVAVQFQTEAFGHIDLSHLKDISTGVVRFTAAGEDGMIDLSGLKSFQGPGWFSSASGSVIRANQLTNLVGVSLFAYFGGHLEVPQIQKISVGSNPGNVIMHVEGDDTLLDLPSVRHLEGSVLNAISVVATNGGAVHLSGLTNIAQGIVYFNADGENSFVDITALKRFTGPGCISQFNGGRVSRNPNTVYTNVCPSFNLAPVILAQPQNTAVFAGSNAAFAVQVDGSAPLEYEWYFNETTLLVGATNATLTISNVGYERNGRYEAVIWNDFGEAYSDAVTLQVAQPLTIAVHGRGTVAKLPDTNHYNFGQSVLLTNTPSRYYVFLRWSDGNTDNPRLITITASNNFYAAIFTNSVELEELVFPQWEKTYGGNLDDKCNVVRRTSDGGIIIGGVSSSRTNGNKTNAPVGSSGKDCWVIKTDSAGEKQWERAFGGTGDEYVADIVLTSDGGYLLVCATMSGINGNKTNGFFGVEDFWLIKLDANGNKEYEREFGGTGGDAPSSGAQTADGGFIIAGVSDSSEATLPNGNKTAPNRGGRDAWLVKLDANANLEWDRTYGGGNDDTASSALQSHDGGYFVAGYLSPQGPPDHQFYAVKLDFAVSNQWSQTLGGTMGTSQVDIFFSARQTVDNGFAAAGYSSSPATGGKNSPNHGGYDFALMKFDAVGNKQWDQSFGGSDNDEVSTVGALQITSDGGYVLVGHSSSDISGNKASTNYGNSDGWVVKTDQAGNKKWEVSFGGVNEDGFSAVEVLADGYLLAGYTQSTNGTRTTPNYGGSDCWLVKLAVREAPVGTPVVLVNGQYSPSNFFAIPATNTIHVTITTTTNVTPRYTTNGSSVINFVSPPVPSNGFTISKSAVIRATVFPGGGVQLTNAPVTIRVVPVYPVTATTSGGGSISVSPDASMHLSNSVVTLRASPLPGWQFMYWSGAASGTNNPLSIVVNQPLTNIHATFGTPIPVSAAGTGGGLVIRTPDASVYPFGTLVHVAAVADPDSLFTAWEGLGLLFHDILNVVVTNLSSPLIANFIPADDFPDGIFTLAVRAFGNGLVTKSPAKSFYFPDEPVVVRATADPGFRFQSWSGSVSGTTNQLSVTMNEHKIVTATFVPTNANLPPVVSLLAPTNDAILLRDQPIVLSVEARDGESAIARAEFYRGTNLLGAVINSLFGATNVVLDFTWTNAPNGTNTVMARAYDVFDSPSDWATVTFFVNQRPNVSLLQPIGSAVFQLPTNVTLIAFTNDPGGMVTEVRFYHGGTNLIGATTSDTFIWTNPPPAAYSLTVEATDNLGAIGVSAQAIPITVLSSNTTYRFATNSYQFNENAGLISIDVLKSGSGPGRVTFAAAPISAQFDRDFREPTITLEFGAGETVKPVFIQLLNNYVPESQRLFTVRLELPSPGGLGAPAAATVSILDDDGALADSSFLDFRVSDSRSTNRGQLRVLLVPTNGQWRLPWEVTWHTNGHVLSDLDPGDYPVEFRPMAGYDTPPGTNYVLFNGLATRINVYPTNASAAAGWLRVDFEPLELVGTGWRLRGEEDYRAGGSRAENLPAGTYIVEFRNVNDNWLTPAPREARVQARVETAVVVPYHLTAQPDLGVALPSALPSYTSIRNGQAPSPRVPFPMAGQLRSVAGMGSGIAVRDHVVLTAAHVLWDEAKQDFVDEVQWFHETHAGEYSPHPIKAMGWYVFEEYATQRRLERQQGLPPGVSTAASRRYDVAAIYFDVPAARHGVAGYLLSTNDLNEWIFSPERKTLIGYPLNGVAEGRMHHIPLDFYTFTRDTAQLYSTEQFLSYPGNSGGPLCVLHTRGDGERIYFPAGVYLGTTGNRSIIRVIDRDVVSLINRAASSAELGVDFTGGGVIRIGDLTGSLCTFARPALIVHLEPPAAVSAGAAWRVQNITTMPFTNAAVARTNLATCFDYTLEFKPIDGYAAPRTTTVRMFAGQDQVYRASYGFPPVLRFDANRNLELSGALDWDYRIEFKESLSPGVPWQTLTNIMLTNSPQKINVLSTNRMRFLRSVLTPVP